jgi:uncharacterized beta barrel domain-containing protein DUF5777
MARGCGHIQLCFVGSLLACATSAFAQTTGPTLSPPSLTQTADEDERKPDPAEPDFRLINLPTTLRLARHTSNFELTHRFNGNLRSGSFGQQLGSLFGLDQGASIGIGYRYAIVRHLQLGFFRTNIDKTIQLHARYDWLHQRPSRPLSVSALVSVEGSNNFRLRRQPALGAVLSRTIAERFAMYASPIWVRHTAAESGVDQDTVFVGLGARARIGRRVYLVGEVAPRLGGYSPGDPAYGFGIEKRVGGHVFQLNFTNAQSTTFGQIARGGFPGTLFLGFNLARKFF